MDEKYKTPGTTSLIVRHQYTDATGHVHDEVVAPCTLCDSCYTRVRLDQNNKTTEAAGSITRGKYTDATGQVHDDMVIHPQSKTRQVTHPVTGTLQTEYFVDGAWYNFETDRQNCGGRANVCPPGYVCEDRVCINFRIGADGRSQIVGANGEWQTYDLIKPEDAVCPVQPHCSLHSCAPGSICEHPKCARGATVSALVATSAGSNPVVVSTLASISGASNSVAVAPSTAASASDTGTEIKQPFNFRANSGKPFVLEPIPQVDVDAAKAYAASLPSVSQSMKDAAKARRDAKDLKQEALLPPVVTTKSTNVVPTTEGLVDDTVLPQTTAKADAILGSTASSGGCILT